MTAAEPPTRKMPPPEPRWPEAFPWMMLPRIAGEELRQQIPPPALSPVLPLITFPSMVGEASLQKMAPPLSDEPTADGQSPEHRPRPFAAVEVESPVPLAVRALDVDDAVLGAAGRLDGDRLAAEIDIAVPLPLVQPVGQEDRVPGGRGVDARLDRRVVGRDAEDGGRCRGGAAN